MCEPLSHSTEKEKGELLTFVGDPEIGETFMFGKGVYLLVFNFLCCEIGISTDMSEYQVSEESYTDLNEEENIIMDEIRDNHWRGDSEEGCDKKNIHALRWEVYAIDNGYLIKR